MIQKSFRLIASNSEHFDMGYRRATGSLVSELDHCRDVLVDYLQSGILLTLSAQPSSSTNIRGSNLKGKGSVNKSLVGAACILKMGHFDMRQE